jgi:hypothetical protein
MVRPGPNQSVQDAFDVACGRQSTEFEWRQKATTVEPKRTTIRDHLDGGIFDVGCGERTAAIELAQRQRFAPGRHRHICARNRTHITRSRRTPPPTASLATAVRNWNEQAVRSDKSYARDPHDILYRLAPNSAPTMTAKFPETATGTVTLAAVLGPATEYRALNRLPFTGRNKALMWVIR